MSVSWQNPYIGPRTFRTEEGDLFFGREREAMDLLSLVISERLVLFYAQSGAGKSSLVNTRLIPGLNAEGDYEVLPIGRVKGDREGLEIKNIYVFNLISSLAQHSIDVHLLSKLSLSEFLSKLDINTEGYFYNADFSRDLAEREDGKFKKYVLIIDQFEELFTTHNEAWEKREDFFKQLAQAMQESPYLWIVLVMREDYIAYLDPYVHFLPGRLRVRYYMQRLEREAALEAIKNPVESLRPYAEGVAETLLENLASIKVQIQGGGQFVQAGQFVEPVQLQVVCHNLWENLSEGTQITHDDLRAVGDVDLSLEKYYDERIRAVAANKKVPERLIREWFEKDLLTSTGTRNMVLRNESNGTRLNDDVIQALLGDLVRAELRAGQIWYELSHDRLIEPVQKSNAKWFEQNLSMFQRQVVLWLQQQHSDSLLLRGEELEAAENEAETMELTKDEQAFLKACQNLRKREQRDQAQRRIIVSALISSVILLVVAVFSTIRANQATRAAREEAQRATSYLTLVLAKSQKFPLSLLLTTEVYRQLDNYQTRGALLDITRTSPQLRQMLFAHDDSAISVAFRPDGKILASGSKDQTIILWDVATYKPIGEPLQGHTGSVQSLAFSPDGETLASGSDDDTIILWDMTSSPPRGQILEGPGHTDSIYSVAFSPDGKTLASGSWDNSIILWDVAKHQPIDKPLNGHDDDVYSVAFSPDGNLLASGSLDGTIVLWDVATRHPMGRLVTADNTDVESVAFSLNGKILASADSNGVITLWDVETRQTIAFLEGHESWVSSLAFSPDEQTLASASADGTIILWDLTTQKARGEPLTGHNGAIYGIAFSSNGMLASAGSDKSIVLWDVIADYPISEFLTAHQATINSVALSPDGKTLVSGSDDSTFIFWDVAKRQPIGSPHPELGNWIKAVTFSPDGTLLALGTYSGGAVLWDTATGKITSLRSPNNNDYEYVFSVAFSPDGETLASGNWDDTIRLWDVNTFQQINELKAHEPRSEAGRPAVTSLAFSPDGKLLASGSDDKTIILWDTATYQPISVLNGHTGFVNGVAFAPDGKILASAGSEGNVILWNIQELKPRNWLSGGIRSAESVAFSPDGKIVASGSSDNSVILWDTQSRQLIGQPLTGHTGSVYSLAFTPDGKTLVSAAKEIILWNLDPNSWLQQSCQRAGRNLSFEEWVQYFPDQKYRATCPQWPIGDEVQESPIP